MSIGRLRRLLSCRASDPCCNIPRMNPLAIAYIERTHNDERNVQYGSLDSSRKSRWAVSYIKMTVDLCICHPIAHMPTPKMSPHSSRRSIFIQVALLRGSVDQTEDIVENEVAAGAVGLELEALGVVHGLLLLVDLFGMEVLEAPGLEK